MAFGAGSAVAHHAVGAILGGGSRSSGSEAAPAQQSAPAQAYGAEPIQYSQAQESPCMSFNQAFLQCLQNNNSEIGMC